MRGPLALRAKFLLSALRLIVPDPEPILRVRGLCVDYFVPPRTPWARRTSRRVLDHVSFDLPRADSLGLVGESGSGKSTIARALLALISPAVGAVRGSILCDGREMVGAARSDLRALRSLVQVVFQDPGGSLNPRMRAADLVAEPFVVHRVAPPGSSLAPRDLRHYVAHTLLPSVGLEPEAVDRFPHEFSGGQRQRLAIARAIALRPKLLILDEPTSALDVSIQAQVLDLLKDLQRDLGLSYLFISHDLGVVAHMCSRVAVLHHGRIVEQGDRDQVLASPTHEYTRHLLAAVHDPELQPPTRAHP